MSGFNLPPGVSARDIPGNIGNEDSTGGPAFPANHFDLADNEHGMTLRDYFAAKAMAVYIAENYGSGEDMARAAYRTADAMLAERARGKP